MSGTPVIAPAPPAFGYAGPTCPHCARSVDPRQIVSGQQTCAWCSRSFEAMRFDPVLPDVSVLRIAEAGPESAHACANHAGNVAVTHCSRCGVFMCSLCRIDADAQVLCPGCFDRLAADGALPSAVSTYRDYGRQAIALAVLGILLPFVGPIAGPASMYFARRRLAQLTAQGAEGGRGAQHAVVVAGLLETILGLVLLVWMFRR